MVNIGLEIIGVCGATLDGVSLVNSNSVNFFHTKTFVHYMKKQNSQKMRFIVEYFIEHLTLTLSICAIL